MVIHRIIFFVVSLLSSVTWASEGAGGVIEHLESLPISVKTNTSYKDVITKSVYGQLAKVHKLDPLMLYAVSLVASSREVENGIMPWPYTLTIEGKQVAYPNRQAAVKALNQYLQEGKRNVAIGLMQVNLMYHPYLRADMLFEPFANIEEGARLLKAAISSTENYHQGLGRYFSWNEIESEMWGRKILEQYKTLVYGG